MTKDNHQAVVEVNAAVAAPTGEEPLEVESGGVEGQREARLMRRATVVPTWKSEFSFACCMYMFLLYCHVFLVRYDQEAGTRWWPFWWANPRGGGGWMRSRPRTAVCVRNWRSHAFHSRIPLTDADGFKWHKLTCPQQDTSSRNGTTLLGDLPRRFSDLCQYVWNGCTGPYSTPLFHSIYSIS